MSDERRQICGTNNGLCEFITKLLIFTAGIGAIGLGIYLEVVAKALSRACQETAVYDDTCSPVPTQVFGAFLILVGVLMAGPVAYHTYASCNEPESGEYQRLQP